MNRAQRRAHRRLWLLLVLLLPAVFVAALAAKTRVERGVVNPAAVQIRDK